MVRGLPTFWDTAADWLERPACNADSTSSSLTETVIVQRPRGTSSRTIAECHIDLLYDGRACISVF